MEIDKRLIELLEQPVDIKRLISKLEFDIDNLEKAALSQPRLRLEAGRFRAQIAMSQSTLKRRLSKIIGKKSIKARRDGEKMTEGAVKNILALDDEVQSAQKKYDVLEAYSEIASQLVEAYKDRSMMLSILTRMRSAEINSRLASVKGETEMEGIRKKARKLQDDLDKIEE